MFKVVYKIVGLAAFSVLLFDLQTAHANTKDVYAECFRCSSSSSQLTALKAAQQHLDEPTKLNVHIADFGYQNVFSYEIYKGNSELTIKTIPAPQNLSLPMKRFKAAYADFEKAIKTFIIPKSIIESAWEYTNCSYCENNLASYLAKLDKDALLQAKETLNNVAAEFGLFQVKIRSELNLPLAAGGNVSILLAITNNSFLKAKIINISDLAGNSVPFESDKLLNTGVIVGDNSAVTEINSFINDFNFYIPDGLTGKVTIKSMP